MMKEWTVEYGTKVMYVYAESEEEAIDQAYLRLGYDPDEDFFAYCEEDYD